VCKYWNWEEKWRRNK